MIPNNEYTTNEFLDAHTYQPLIQRFSMGNIYPSSKCSVESGRSNIEQAPQVVLTGTKGLLFSTSCIVEELCFNFLFFV